MSRWYRTHVGLVTDAKLGEAALISETSRAVVIAVWHAILESCADVNDAGRFDTTPRSSRHTPHAPKGIAKIRATRGRTPMRPNTKVPAKARTP